MAGRLLEKTVAGLIDLCFSADCESSVLQVEVYPEIYWRVRTSRDNRSSESPLPFCLENKKSVASTQTHY